MKFLLWRNDNISKKEEDFPERPKSKIIAEINSYNGKMNTPIYQEDLDLLTEELGEGYTVKRWFWNKHIRVAVIKDGVRL